jgi:hypothetical protein
MDFSRRQMIGAGMGAGAVAALSASPLIAATTSDAPVTSAPLPVRTQPRVMVDPVIDARLLARARASFDRHRSRLRNTDLVGITDFSQPSGSHRFFLLDTNTGRVTRHLVSHGRGSDPGHTGWLQRFSNEMGSNASSNGAYVTGDYYYGRYGRSLRLSGLDYSNSRAYERAIVVHSAWYAEPHVVQEHGRLGRSEGCFALSNASLQEVLARLGPGRFLYADRV